MSSGITDFDEKVKLVIGNLLLKAESNPLAKSVLTAFDSSKDVSVNRAVLSSSRYNAATLNSCAQFLDIDLETSDGERIYSNKPALANRIILEIQSFYPAICADCDQEYSVEFDSETKPALHCFLCFQGSHNCASYNDKENGVHLAGSVWLCKSCHENNNPIKPKKSKSRGGSKAPSKQPSLPSKLEQVSKNKSAPDTSDTSKRPNLRLEGDRRSEIQPGFSGKQTGYVSTDLQSPRDQTVPPSSSSSPQPELHVSSANSSIDASPSSEPCTITSNELAEHSSIWLLNVQSLNPSAHSTSRWKATYLADEINQEQAKNHIVPFVALTETWLKSYIQDAQITIPGYNLFRCDRSARVGGGVALYSHEKLPITNVQTYDDKYCQALICTCESQKLFVCVVYRPPECPTLSFRSCLDFIDQYIAQGADGEYQLSLLGDFNLPIIGWSNYSIIPGGSSCSMETAGLLLDFMSENLCTQHVLDPTRNNNVLDLYISNSEDLVSHVSTSDTHLSDHRLVEIFLSYNPCSMVAQDPPDFSISSFRSLDFQKADFSKINSMISSTKWAELFDSCDQEDIPELFSQTLLQLCEECCPRKKPPKNKARSSVRIPSRRKRKLQSQLKVANNNPHSPLTQLDSLKRKLALAHIDIRDAINQDFQHREEQAVEKVKNNPKYFYSYAKKFSKKKSNISLLFDKDGNIKSDPKDIANLLQNQFLSVFSDPSKTSLDSASFLPPEIKHPFDDEMLDFFVSDIADAIEDIKPNAASGPDEIPVSLLKNCKEAIAEPIHLIWKKCFSSGSVPSSYKFSHIFPLHKKDSRALPANYRPISLTSHVIKIFERVIRKKLVEYLEINDLICNKQHGFRSGRSCLTQLLHHFDDVLEALANNSDFDSIYLDYAKAFDKVDHKLLLRKLQLYGIHPKILNWIESFLIDRKQAVVVDGHLSFLALILSGVPQGTVLGPILFLIFINDIDQCIMHSIIRCFADDTRISIAIRSEKDVSLLQSDLYNVMNWSERNNMALHRDKFEYMCHITFNKNHTLPELPFISEFYQYTVSTDTSLEPVHQLRDLGILISSDLSWSPHIRAIADKARQKASWVLSVFHTRSPMIMLTFYKSMVRSLVEYCCPLWHPSKISDIQELESVQKTFISRIAGMREMHYWDCLVHLSLMSLQRRRERFIILHMWKILHGKTSNDLNIRFVARPRFGNLAIIPPSRKNSSAANQSLFDNSFDEIISV
ncbi:hypothetical protein ACHWQZ_G017709 [Mnemiopsis leidyi]